MSLKEIKEEKDTKPIEESEKEKITREEYEAALAILEKQKEAKETVEKFEAELKYEDDPILEIMEKGVMTVVGFEVIPNRNFCRITAFKYEFEGKIVNRTISYLNSVENKNFTTIKEDKSILI